VTLGEDASQYFLFAKMPIVIQNKRAGYYMVAKDVTVAYETLDNLERILIISLLAGTLLSFVVGHWLAGRSLKPIKQAYDSKQDFLANASHELKTPLSVIMLSTETLEGEIPPEEAFQRQIVAGIKDEAVKMSELVSHLLYLARKDSHHMLKDRETLNLSGLVESELKRFDGMASQKKISIGSSIIPGIHISGDRKLLASVIGILVDNAIKYTPENGKVLVELSQTVLKNQSDIQLSVKDTGVGIPVNELDHIFERFYRLETSRSKETGGTGLGLAIAKEIVEEHGGSIKVNSIEKVGTTFVVSFHMSRKTKKSESGNL
jgi:signal transduction histidine kinase